MRDKMGAVAIRERRRGMTYEELAVVVAFEDIDSMSRSIRHIRNVAWTILQRRAKSHVVAIDKHVRALRVLVGYLHEQKGGAE